MLRKELRALQPPHVLTRGEKNRIISCVISLTSYTPPDRAANAPVQLDIDLHREIWIEGKVSDKETGGPVARVLVHYEALVENPFARQLTEFCDLNDRGDFYDRIGGTGDQLRGRTKSDGTYRLVGLPGRGIVGVYLYDKPYLQEGYGGLDVQGRFQIDSPRAGPAYADGRGHALSVLPRGRSSRPRERRPSASISSSCLGRGSGCG